MKGCILPRFDGALDVANCAGNWKYRTPGSRKGQTLDELCKVTRALLKHCLRNRDDGKGRAKYTSTHSSAKCADWTRFLGGRRDEFPVTNDDSQHVFNLGIASEFCQSRNCLWHFVRKPTNWRRPNAAWALHTEGHLSRRDLEHEHSNYLCHTSLPCCYNTDIPCAQRAKPGYYVGHARQAQELQLQLPK